MKGLKFFVFLSLLTLLAFPVNAQRQTGSLDGKIVDDDQIPLPGVSVTISSPALMGTRSFVTSDTGSFRFPALPPGTYNIKCELTGFQIVIRADVIISVGKTSTIIITLVPSTLSEEIEVVAASPVVDVKSSKQAVTFTRDLMENIPTSRDFLTIVNTAPGVTDSLWVHGSAYTHNIFSLDGLNVSDPLVSGWLPSSPDLGMIEEVEMQVGAHPADVGSAPGAYVNIVTRSGGNDFSGGATVFYFSDSFVGTNLSQEQLDSLDVSTPGQDKLQADLALNFGGPIIKDRLWFFLAGRRQYQEATLTGFDQNLENSEWYGMAKLTAQFGDNIRFMGYYSNDNVGQPIYLATDARVSSFETSSIFDESTNSVNAQLNIVLSPNAFLDIRGMWYNNYYDFRYQDGATWQNTDIGTGAVTGAYRWMEYLNKYRYFGSATATTFLDNILGGDHEIKVGAELEYTKMRNDCWMPVPLNSFTLFDSPYALGFPVGLIMPLGFGPNEGEGQFKIDTNSLNFFIQDTWTIKDRVTLNLGLRYDGSSASLPAQFAEEVSDWLWLDPAYYGRNEYDEVKDLVTFNTFSPRLGIIFDILGTGRTVAKASFSRYRDYLMQAHVYGINPNTYSMRQYVWIDFDLNQQLDPWDFYQLVFTWGRSGQDPRDLVDPNLKAPIWNEFIIGIEHELFGDFRVGVSYIYKSHLNIYDNQEKNAFDNWGATYTVTDPGYDGIFGTEDDAPLTVFDRTKPIEPLWQTNPRDATKKYQALEFVFQKRMSNKWQFLGSLTWSKFYGTAGNLDVQTIGSAFNTPNYYINRDGRQDFDRPLVIKLQGTYILPYGIIFSGYFLSTSGAPYNRILTVSTPNGGPVTVNAEQQGIRRHPSWNRLDLRLEKEFRFGSTMRLGLFLDLYNAFNSANITFSANQHGVIQLDGSFVQDSNWLKVSSIDTPRTLKLGIRFTF